MSTGIVLGILVTALWGGSAQARLPTGFWSVFYRYQDVSQQNLTYMHRGRVETARWPLYWPTAEPIRGFFYWNVADRIIGGFAARGIRILPVLFLSPSYEESNPVAPPLDTPQKQADWKNFVRAAVGRYGPGGTYWSGGASSPYHKQFGARRRAKPIRAWQVWDEPNLPHYFATSNPVKQYAKLVRITHDAIASVDPHASVVLAGMPGFPKVKFKSWRFLNRFYRVHGIKREFDVAAAHPYAITTKNLRKQMNRIRGTMNRHHDRRTPIWITELGWGSAHPNGRLNKGPHGQAKALRKSFKLILHNRRRWRVGRLTWFEWHDPPPNTGGCTFCDSAGLFTQQLHPKPSWRAYKHFTRR
jgi:Glycosyl hydrolase catalytic core